MEFSGLLTVTVFLPLAGAIIIALLLRGDKLVRAFAALIATADLVLTIVVFSRYDSGAGGVQMVDRITNWIPGGGGDGFAVQYFMGVDGLSVPFVLLTGLLGFVAVTASWNIRFRVREYFMWLLALQTGVMGVFISLDFLMFFLFWEVELLPMFFLISIWGSEPRKKREYSAMKFLIFTFLGSAFMLVGILVLFFSTGTFDMTVLPDAIAGSKLLLPAGVVFTLLFVAFAVKLPLWPFHTWLPDAHTDAPTAGSVMLAGVLLKMGGYGMIRISIGMFPEVVANVAWLLATAGVMNIVYGAIVVFRQTDLKRLIAYSSVSHMGFVVLGLASVAGVAGSVSPLGLTGASMQMFTHGTITGLLFLLVGFIYDKAHTRYIPDLGGLAKRMPFITIALMVAGLASLGLPGTSGFVAEIMVFLGTIKVWAWATVIGAFGVVLAAGYILWTIQRVMFGPIKERFDDITDASGMQYIPIAALVIVIIVVGVYPSFISDVFSSGIEPIARSLEQVSQARLR
ncbi:MAG: NADH-quinone oxidoreductase subunit M [Chloroflexi bacterium]|nr:NADH-quinone oxidoreductase subunit M [Chloroflexota bacterium]